MESTYLQRLALAAAAFVLPAAMAHAMPIVTPDITYTWAGDCLDCNPPEDTSTPATATVVLQNYAPGTELTSTSQIASFQYKSLLFSVATILPSFVSGNIPSTGGPATFDIKWPGGSQGNDSYEFHSYMNGHWLFLENFRLNDIGTNSVFIARAPEPATIALLGLTLAGLGFSRRKQL